MSLRSYYPGETMRLSAQSLTHADTGRVTSGATVTIALYNPDDTLNTTASATADGDDWFIDLAAPPTVGTYTVRATATVSGATWKGKGTVTVATF